MPVPPTSSRPSAPNVPPIEHQGVRYQEDRHDDRTGDQPGGYLVATDARTDARLWRLKVYEIARSGPPGAPMLPRYFRSLRLTEGGTELEVVNEAGGVYRVDLAGKTVTQVAGPAETAASIPQAKPKPTPR